MRKGKLITITLLIVMLFVSIMPSFGVQAATQTSITFNSNLYNAIKASLQLQSISATYNDAQNTITIDEDILNSITTLKLSNFGIDDLTGLENFTGVTNLDLSANEITSESNLGVLNNMNLTYLDLSSNAISDLSEVTDISNVETLNLHNQKFNQAIIIDNSIVKNGTTEYVCELPQIINEFGNPLSASWLVPEINDNNNNDNFKFKWTASGITKLQIGETNGDQYTGLATLKIKVADVNSPLYNSEINLYYVVINENQRGIEIKDRNLYKAIKSQLYQGQHVNLNLSDYTSEFDLYDEAYDEQMIFVINENYLVNKIQSLILDNKRIKDLTGIEKFVGLKDELDVSSNYIDTIKKVVELQENKDEEEVKLQERVKTKIAQLKERLETLENLQKELENTIKSYNEIVGRYNAIVNATDKSNAATQENALLNDIKTNAAKYVELSGDSVNIFGVFYNTTSSINNISTTVDQQLDEIPMVKYPNGGTIGTAKFRVSEKTRELFETYKESYLLVTYTNSNVKKLTEEEIMSLSLEDAKSVLQTQVSKVNALESYLTQDEKYRFKLVYPGIDFGGESETPVKDYFTQRLKDFEEAEAGVSVYTNEIIRILELDIESTQNAEIKYNTFMGNGNFDEDLVSLTNRIVKEDEIEAYVLLPRLDSLDMSGNLIENIDEIATLKELKTLKLADNEIVNINNVNWSGFEDLKILDLSFNNISEINSLEVLTKIRELYLAKNLISGKIIFNITGMKELEKLDLSSNQIDDIENLISQFEFIAKNYDMEAGDYLVSNLAPEISLKNQNLQMNIKVEKQNDKISVELPMIFRQLEALQWDRTSFGTTSYYGNVTNDGKAVILDVSNVGEKTAIVTVLGNEVKENVMDNETVIPTIHYKEGIGSGTKCTIYCNVVEKLEEQENQESTNEDTGNGEQTNEESNNSEQTNEESQVVITINTVSSSAVSAVRNVNNTNYLLVKPNTKVSEVLNEININKPEYSVVLKDATATNELNTSDELKTNTILTVNGLEDKINCIIVVKGDVTGDGEVSISDVLKVNQYRNNKIELTDAEFLAGNVEDSNDEIGIEDVLKLNQYRLNKIDTL